MANLEELVQGASGIMGIRCRPASEDDLEILRDLEFPDIIVDFFAKYEPEVPLEYGPSIEPIRNIEMMCNGPIHEEAGLLPFGNLMSGDTLCFDPDIVDKDGWPAVVCIDHELVHEDSDEDDVLAAAKPYCANLPAVLEIMIANSKKRRG